jgi:hypothetical protein
LWTYGMVSWKLGRERRGTNCTRLSIIAFGTMSIIVFFTIL